MIAITRILICFMSSFASMSFRYQRAGSKTPEKSLQSELDPHPEDHRPKPEAMAEQK